MILSDEQKMIQEMARDFSVEQLAPYSRSWDEMAYVPDEIFFQMGALGMMGMCVPEEWDGAGVDTVSYALAIEEIAAGDGATSTIMSVHNSVGCAPILNFGTKAQKERFLRPLARGEMVGSFCLTEPQAGSDASALQTRAVKVEGGYVLNGMKQFVTSGKRAGMAIVFAVTNPEAGKKGISAFIVPTSSLGFEVVRIEEKLGLKGSDTAQISLTDCFVSDENLLGAEGQGYKIALAHLEGGRIGIAAQAVGMARASYQHAVAYAKERQSFGKAIIHHQAISFRLADMLTQIAAARQLVLHAAVLKDHQMPCLMEASQAKLFASEMAERVCSDALQIHGGYGYLKDFPLEQIYRDVRICQIYEGTSDIQRLVIGRAIGG